MANSNIPPRSGFTINILQNSGIIAHVQNNVIVESQASLIDMLNVLPAKLHRDRLEIDCQEIFDNYKNYTQHALSGLPMHMYKLCTKSAPSLDKLFREELNEIEPRDGWFTFNKQLTQLEATSNAYVKVLSIYFESLANCSPSSVSNDITIVKYIEHAIDALKQKLRNTLIPNGKLEGSLLLWSLLHPDREDKSFPRYLRYFDEYNSFTGVQRLLSEARDNDIKNLFALPDSKPESDCFERLTEELIRFIGIFEYLLEARDNYLLKGVVECTSPVVHD